MNAVLEGPTSTTASEQKVAQESLRLFDSISDSFSEPEVVDVDVAVKMKSPSRLKIPAKALRVLSDVIHLMAEGKSFIVISMDEELSSQQAADMLNISRPSLNKLLDQGRIPHTRINSHRRIKMQDLMAFIEEFKQQREAHLSQLNHQTRDLDI